MARKKPKGKGVAFTAFNVNYEDGMVTSNRRVSNALLDQSFGESFRDLARTAIEDQDNEIAKRSGRLSRATMSAIPRSTGPTAASPSPTARSTRSGPWSRTAPRSTYTRSRPSPDLVGLRGKRPGQAWDLPAGPRVSLISPRYLPHSPRTCCIRLVLPE